MFFFICNQIVKVKTFDTDSKILTFNIGRCHIFVMLEAESTARRHICLFYLLYYCLSVYKNVRYFKQHSNINLVQVSLISLYFLYVNFSSYIFPNLLPSVSKLFIVNYSETFLFYIAFIRYCSWQMCFVLLLLDSSS